MRNEREIEVSKSVKKKKKRIILTHTIIERSSVRHGRQNIMSVLHVHIYIDNNL